MALKLGEAYTLMMVKGLAQHNRDLQQGERGVKRYAGESGKATKGLAGGFSLVKGAVGGVTAALGLTLLAVNRVVAAHDVWRRNMREIVAETRQAAKEMTPFLALQEPGTKAERAQAVSALGERYGITDRGVLFDTVQALESVTGSFDRGLQAAAEVFKASLLQLPPELGRELEVMGLSAGAGLGETIRLAYAAGEVSGRTPTAMAQAARAIGVWEDPAFMFALAGRLAGTLQEAQLGTYMERLGSALQPTGGLGEWFASQGVSETATQRERFEALARYFEGKPASALEVLLERAGMSEIRERRAVRTLLPEAARIAREAGQIRLEAAGGLFERELAEVERERPMVRRAREAQRAETKYRESLANSARERAAHEQDMLERARAIALQRLGVTEGFWFDFVDDERVGGWNLAQFHMWGALRQLWPFAGVETAGGTVPARRFKQLYERELARAMEELSRPLPEAPPRAELTEYQKEMLGRGLQRIPWPGGGAGGGMGAPGMGLMWAGPMMAQLAAMAPGAEAGRRAPRFYGFEEFHRSIQERADRDAELKLSERRNVLLDNMNKALEQKVAKELREIRAQIPNLGALQQ